MIAQANSSESLLVDNITHAFAGMLIAEACVPKGHEERRRVRRLAYATSILANNIPDADFVLTGLSGGPLGYLLRHRGHTHTLLLALPQAALVWLAVLGWARLRRIALGRMICPLVETMVVSFSAMVIGSDLSEVRQL